MEVPAVFNSTFGKGPSHDFTTTFNNPMVPDENKEYYVALDFLTLLSPGWGRNPPTAMLFPLLC